MTGSFADDWPHGIFHYLNVNFSAACSIPDGDSVLITGGRCKWGSMGPDCGCNCAPALPSYGLCSMYMDGCIRPATASSKVHRYDREGWMEDLPDLNDGRYGHGCASFTMNQKQVGDIWFRGFTLKHRTSLFLFVTFEIIEISSKKDPLPGPLQF